MTVEIVAVPCLRDNFAYLVHGGGETALVDAPEAPPIQAALDARGWSLSRILVTHHHPDHVDGIAALRMGAEVIGAAADSHRLPELDRMVVAGETFEVCGGPCEVIDVPGHTIGHVAFHMPHAGAAFTADSLMAMGCGRLFEGEPEQMRASLARLSALPEETVVYQGHDYMETNLRFALDVEPSNANLTARAEADAQRRAEDSPFHHPSLGEELATNPFLRAGSREIAASLGMEGASEAEVFAALREKRNGY